MNYINWLLFLLLFFSVNGCSSNWVCNKDFDNESIDIEAEEAYIKNLKIENNMPPIIKQEYLYKENAVDVQQLQPPQNDAGKAPDDKVK